MKGMKILPVGFEPKVLKIYFKQPLKKLPTPPQRIECSCQFFAASHAQPVNLLAAVDRHNKVIAKGKFMFYSLFIIIIHDFLRLTISVLSTRERSILFKNWCKHME